MTTARARTPRRVVGKSAKSGKLSHTLNRTALYVAVTAGAIAFGLPFAWMVRTTVMPPQQVYRFPPEWIPEEIHWEYFTGILRHVKFGGGAGYRFPDWLWNSFMLSTVTAVGAVLSSSLVGFAFGRLRFRGRDALFVIVLSTMILPQHVRMIPTFLLFTKLDWVGTYKPLIVPTYFAPAFFVFLLRQFFMQIPREMDDSAYIDGCSPLGLFFRIHLPLSLPVLGVVMIFQFNGMWNNFFGPLLYLRDVAKYPVSVGLRYFQGRFQQTEIQALMAASLVSLIPPILLFFFAQRRMIQGIVITGIKG